MDEATKKIDFLRNYLEDSRKLWTRRTPEAYVAEHKARIATSKSWRHMKAVEFALHEMNHPGNRPFVIGMG
jgi:hypothetical protein